MSLSTQWQRSTRCANTSNCVEVRRVDDMILDDTWRKATKSNNQGACVELRKADDTIEVRDSKNPTGPVLSFTGDEWDAFLDGAKSGEFEIA